VSAAGEVRMAVAGAVLSATDRLTAGVVEVLARVSHHGVIADEGLTSGTWLRTFGDRTVADERMLANTAERLADMPHVRAWFLGGELSWPTVRGIVDAVRSLTREQRQWVDATLADDPERFLRLDADDRVWSVADLADQARPDLHREREQRAKEREYLRWQKDFDGGSQGQFALNAENTAILEEAIENIKRQQATKHAAADDDGHDAASDDGGSGEPRSSGEQSPSNHTHDAADDDGHADAASTKEQATAEHTHPHNEHGHGPQHADDEDDGDDVRVTRDGYMQRQSWSNAQALVALCKQRLGRIGGTAPSAARPSMIVIADLAALTGNGDGDGVGSATAQLLLRGGRGPVRLTPAAAQRLACDATLRLVFTDGHEILGSTDPHATVSPALRAALVARDGGCRFPGCHQPPQLCENHHVIFKSDGGPTILENMALECPAHHHAIHDGQWHATLHPDGTMTFTRHGVTLTSLPCAAKRMQPPTPPPRRPTTRRPPEPDKPETPTRPPPPQDDDLPF
jgi:Domain of unknown function (DUF222)